MPASPTFLKKKDVKKQMLILLNILFTIEKTIITVL